MSPVPPPEAIYPDLTTAFNVIQLHTKDYGYSAKEKVYAIARKNVLWQGSLSCAE
jgi:hypothetical protein